MRKRLRKIYRSISTKVILLILLLIVPLNVFEIYSVNSTMSRVMEQVSLTEQNIVDNYIKDLGARMDNTSSLLFYYLTQNPDCMRMIQSEEPGYEYDNAKLKCYYSIKNMSWLIAGGDGYFYYMKNMDEMVAYVKNSSDNIKPYILERISEENTARGWQLCEVDGKQFLLLFMEESNYVYGGWLNLETIKQEIRQTQVWEPCEISFTAGEQEKKEKGMIQATGSHKKIYLNLKIDEGAVVTGMTLFERIQYMMPFVFILLIPFLFLLLKSMLIRPLEEINEAHRQIRHGHQDYRITKKSSSTEYEEAYSSFNRMADELRALKIESYERKIEKKKMELRNLQLQIRPHFLLNTFNLIYTLAQRKEMDAIQDSAIYLSEYFRYIFRSGKELELFPKELHLLEGYSKLVNVRYPEGVEIVWNFDPEIMLIRIPPLLLLNFVENAVKYGYKAGEELHITIIGEYTDSEVIFHIINDGNGMDPAMVERNNKIFSGELEPEETLQHVGLYNSLKRIKYFYGESAAITLTCDEESGETCFCLHFPYDLEVADDSADD